MGLINFLSISEMNIEFKTEYRYYYVSIILIIMIALGTISYLNKIKSFQQRYDFYGTIQNEEELFLEVTLNTDVAKNLVNGTLQIN